MLALSNLSNLSNVAFNAFPTLCSNASVNGNVNGNADVGVGVNAAMVVTKPDDLKPSAHAPAKVINVELNFKSDTKDVSELGHALGQVHSPAPQRSPNPFLSSMFEDDDDVDADNDNDVDIDIDIDAYVDDDTEMQILYSTPYPPPSIVVPSSPSLRPRALPTSSTTSSSLFAHPTHPSSYTPLITPLPALPLHLNPLRAHRYRRPVFPLRRRAGESPLKREVRFEDGEGDSDSESESGSEVGSEGTGNGRTSRASSCTSVDEDEREEKEVMMDVDVEEVAYFAPPGLPPPSSRAAVPCAPQTTSTTHTSTSTPASAPSIPISPDVSRAMQDFHSTITRTLALLSPSSPSSPDVPPTPTKSLSPSDKSHTIAQISRCIFIVQRRIEELGDLVVGSPSSYAYTGAMTRERERELMMEKQLLEVELCGMEGLWRDVRGRLVGGASCALSGNRVGGV